MNSSTVVRKSPARLAVLEAAQAGKLEWKSMGWHGGRYVMNGQNMGAEPVYPLIEAGALKHTIPGLPRRTGPVEITEAGAALLAKWKG